MNCEDGGLPGRWLRQRREHEGLSQEELANRSGLSVRTVSSLERGSTRTPHPRTIRLLGENLGLSAKACDELIAAYRASSRGGPVATSPEPAQLAGTAGFVVPRELPGLATALRRPGRRTGRAQRARRPGPWPGAGAGGDLGDRRDGWGGEDGAGAPVGASDGREVPDGQLYVNLRGYGPGEPMTAGEALTGFLRAWVFPGRISRPGPSSARPGTGACCPACGRRSSWTMPSGAWGRYGLAAGAGLRDAGDERRYAWAGLAARDGAQRVDLDLVGLMAMRSGSLRAPHRQQG